MNYVAHQVLSFSNENLQIGNLLGEVIKGKDYEIYPKEIQQGVLLHRFIDSFTDSHEIVKECSAIFHETQGKFSPIIIDVIFDYFLIKNWSLYNSVDFLTFKNDCYTTFRNINITIPEKLQNILFYLLKYDWFVNYSTLEGIHQTLSNIGKRTKFDNQLNQSIDIIKENLPFLEKKFLAFFPELEDNCRQFLFK